MSKVSQNLSRVFAPVFSAIVTFAFIAMYFLMPSLAKAEAYKYDSLGRIIEVMSDDFRRTNYAYDKAGNRITKQVSITALAPVANTDMVSTLSNASLTFDPRINDTDPQSLALTITAVSTAAHGTVTQNGLSLNYIPTANYVGSDTFTYTISNTATVTSTGTVLMIVSARTPVANPDTYATNSNTLAIIDPRTNDTDPQLQALSITAVGAAAHGTVTKTATSVTYTPATNYIGSDSFSYTVANTSGQTASSTITFTTNAQNPVANTYSTLGSANATLVFDPRAVDTDPQGQALTIMAVGGPSHGSATATATSITYIPAVNYVGNDSFTYTITNTSGKTSTGTVNITLSANQPSASTDSITTDSNTALTFNPRANDSDPQGQALTISSVSVPAHGSTTQNGTSVTYTPATNYVGADAFSYVIVNTSGKTATATVNATVTARTPVVQNDSLSTVSNAAASLTPLSNDFDPQGQALTISSVANGAHGTNTLVGATVTYTPALNYVGSDSFTYVASNSSGKTTTGTVSVTIAARAPTANTDAVTTNLNTPLSFNPRTNDTDPQAQALTIVGVTVPAGTAASVSFTGTALTITPNTGFAGNTYFTYIIANISGQQATGTVNLHVNAAPPVAVPDSAAAIAGVYKTINVLANDSDPQFQTLTISAVGAPAHGSAVFSGAGTISYTASAGFVGTDSFTYTITNTFGLTSTTTVNVSVTAPPVTINVSVNSISWSSDTILPGGTVKSANTVVTPTGGVGAYTYLWEFVSGATAIAPTSSTSASTSWRDFNVQNVGAESGWWRCKVTDSQGNVGYSTQIGIGFSYVDNR